MKLYVLDTDIAGFLQQEHPTVISRINALPETDTVATTIITFGEDLTGWLPACKRANNGTNRSRAYERLQTGLEFYRDMICLPFDSIAAAIFDQLRPQHRRMGTNDLAIAAITLSVNGILITRNVVDFERIQSLRIEDWTQ